MKILKKTGAALKFVWKNNRAWMITTCLLLVICITVSSLAVSVPLFRNTLNSVFGEERRVVVKGDPAQAQYFTTDEGIETKEDALAAANALNELLCEEGFVLLRNDGALPLARRENQCFRHELC